MSGFFSKSHGVNYYCKQSVGTLLKLLLTMPGNMNPFITTLFCTGYKHPSALVGSYSGCAGGISPFAKSSAQSLTALLYKETQRAFKTRSWEG